MAARTFAIEYFERALKKDPNYTVALVGMARCYILLGTIHRGPRETHPHARKLLALLSAETTTDGCYQKLVEAGFRRAFEKVNAVDALLHARFVGFEDFARLAIAELHIAAKGLRPRLDPGAPLVIFADHGFRIAPDGRSYTHGRDSTLERVVPVLRLAPG